MIEPGFEVRRGAGDVRRGARGASSEPRTSWYEEGVTPGQKNDELELELPSLDGEEEHVTETDVGHELPESHDDGGDPLDDAAFGGKDAGEEELGTLGAEGGWLDDAEAAAGLDIGAIDVTLEPEGKVLDDAEPETSGGLEDLIQTEEAYVADGGEEGPLAADEELREEDLPELDADEDGDMPDDALYDRSLLGGDDELRWADRAWAPAHELARDVVPDSTAVPGVAGTEESGLLLIPGDEPRDQVWKSLDETGRVMAAASVPGDAIVLAFASPDRGRAFLVRIPPDGEPRIIAEVDPRLEDDGSSCDVTSMKWDVGRGCLVVLGSFGIHAYRPA